MLEYDKLYCLKRIKQKYTYNFFKEKNKQIYLNDDNNKLQKSIKQ